MRGRLALLRRIAAPSLVLLVVGLLGDSPVRAATPALSVEPSSGLIDLQFVTVAGSAFTPGATVRVSQCLSSDPARCDPFTDAFPAADLGARFQTSFRVRREIAATVNSAARSDCAVVSCVISAVNIGNNAERATAAIAFDAKQPALRYKPSVDRKVVLTDGGFVVEITGTLRCTQPFGIGIVGHLDQASRPNGYPFNSFVNCNRKTPWSATVIVAPSDLPFLKGHAQVQAIAIGPSGDPQVGTVEDVTMVER